MNRIIKFRAWDKERKEYLSAGCVSIEIHRGRNPINKIILDKNYEGYEKRFILEQYTGFKDAKGKEIYEGDILQIAGIIPVCVSFDHGSFIENTISPTKSLWQFITDYEKFGPPEVIGNIHANKELL